MENTESIYISPEIITQAQGEGANYVRALEGLMNDMRGMARGTRILPYIQRLGFIHDRIYPRVMLILAGVTDFDDVTQREYFSSYQDEFIKERARLNTMIRTMQSTNATVQLLAACKEKEWCQEAYEIANEIFDDWGIDASNQLYPLLDK